MEQQIKSRESIHGMMKMDGINYFSICQQCGARLNQGEKCSCREENLRRTMLQRHRENYEITERLGGNRKCQHYMN